MTGAVSEMNMALGFEIEIQRQWQVFDRKMPVCQRVCTSPKDEAGVVRLPEEIRIEVSRLRRQAVSPSISDCRGIPNHQVPMK